MVDKSRSRRIQFACYIFARSIDSVNKAIDASGNYDKFLDKFAPYLPGYDSYDKTTSELQNEETFRKPVGNFEKHWVMLFSCILTMYVLYTWCYEVEHFPHGVEKAMRIMTSPKPNDWNAVDKIMRVRAHRFYGSPMVTSRYPNKRKHKK
jgi:hypothetical protein